MLKISFNHLLLASLLQSVVVSAAFAFDLDIEGNTQQSVRSIENVSLAARVQLKPFQYSQNRRSNLRSRSDVIHEVKTRYNAEVLKITLDERQQLYRVRVLMPNGKVRNLQVSARR
jgi:hypothetical protein